jgi:hypothetical protein
VTPTRVHRRPTPFWSFLIPVVCFARSRVHELPFRAKTCVRSLDCKTARRRSGWDKQYFSTVSACPSESRPLCPIQAPAETS